MTLFQKIKRYKLFINYLLYSNNSMQFYDEVSVHIESGKGGDGVVSARRESGVPFGGPAV